MIFSAQISLLSFVYTIKQNYVTSQKQFIWLHSAASDRAAINAFGRRGMEYIKTSELSSGRKDVIGTLWTGRPIAALNA